MKNKLSEAVERWLDGEYEPDGRYPEEKLRPDLSRDEAKRERSMMRRFFEEHEATTDVAEGRRNLKLAYNVIAVVCCITLITVLLTAISFLPRYGEDHEAMDEVSYKYIEDGIKDTGAVNVVAGMILDYRAFDTLGESFVLFTALISVFILLRRDGGDTERESLYTDISSDPILRRVASVIVPSSLTLGIYIILNGHLSAGGGFAGGTVMGAGLILYSVAFSQESSARFLSERTFKTVTSLSLGFYALAKCYSFFTGANGLESGIPLGIPGNIISSGLILPLNIAVGMVVGCTMYGIWRMFTKGAL